MFGHDQTHPGDSEELHRQPGQRRQVAAGRRGPRALVELAREGGNHSVREGHQVQDRQGGSGRDQARGDRVVQGRQGGENGETGCQHKSQTII